jgi:signal transduction histidine kinase
MQPVRNLYARIRAMEPFRADALLAAGFALAGVVESVLVTSHGHSRPLTAAAAVLTSVPVAWRRRATFLAVVGFATALLVQSPFDTFLFQSLTAPFIALLLLAYTIGRHEQGARIWAEAGVLIVGVEVSGAIAQGIGPEDIFWVGVLLGGPLLAGRGIRSRVLLQREMRRKAERLAAEREVRARRAMEEERTRIASELQAVVANGVSAMVVQAGAVPRLLEAGDSSRAGEALAVIEETGRDALAEMRRLLGVLRRDDEGPALAPQPSLARADALVARVANHGFQAELSVEGDPVPLSPGVDLAGYRVLQEALASTRAAEGVSRADVAIVYGEDDVTVTVRDDRAGVDGGTGPDASALLALRERVGLYGGALRAVPRRGGRGFKVEARLPKRGPS